mgnify:CR=1 FL=1
MKGELLGPPQIENDSLKPSNIVLEPSKPIVTTKAEKTTDPSSLMVMVYIEPLSLWGPVANRANSFLLGQEFVIVLIRKPIACVIPAFPRRAFRTEIIPLLEPSGKPYLGTMLLSIKSHATFSFSLGFVSALFGEVFLGRSSHV